MVRCPSRAVRICGRRGFLIRSVSPFVGEQLFISVSARSRLIRRRMVIGFGGAFNHHIRNPVFDAKFFLVLIRLAPVRRFFRESVALPVVFHPDILIRVTLYFQRVFPTVGAVGFAVGEMRRDGKGKQSGFRGRTVNLAVGANFHAVRQASVIMPILFWTRGIHRAIRNALRSVSRKLEGYGFAAVNVVGANEIRIGHVFDSRSELAGSGFVNAHGADGSAQMNGLRDIHFYRSGFILIIGAADNQIRINSFSFTRHSGEHANLCNIPQAAVRHGVLGLVFSLNRGVRRKGTRFVKMPVIVQTDNILISKLDLQVFQHFIADIGKKDVVTLIGGSNEHFPVNNMMTIFVHSVKPVAFIICRVDENFRSARSLRQERHPVVAQMSPVFGGGGILKNQGIISGRLRKDLFVFPGLLDFSAFVVHSINGILSVVIPEDRIELASVLNRNIDIFSCFFVPFVVSALVRFSVHQKNGLIAVVVIGVGGIGHWEADIAIFIAPRISLFQRALNLEPCVRRFDAGLRGLGDDFLMREQFPGLIIDVEMDAETVVGGISGVCESLFRYVLRKVLDFVK